MSEVFSPSILRISYTELLTFFLTFAYLFPSAGVLQRQSVSVIWSRSRMLTFCKQGNKLFNFFRMLLGGLTNAANV